MLEVISEIPSGCEIVLTPYKIQSHGEASYVKQLRLLENSAGDTMLEWEGYSELLELFESIGHNTPITQQTRYLIAGDLRPDKTCKKILTGLPRFGAVILKDEPIIDLALLQDIRLKGAVDASPFCWGCAQAYSRQRHYAGKRNIATLRPIELRLDNIIEPPTAQEIYNYFYLSSSIPLPDGIYRHEN